jgi:hypothetical protein
MSSSFPHSTSSVSPKGPVPLAVTQDQDLKGLGLSSRSNPEELCDLGRVTSPLCTLVSSVTKGPIFKWGNGISYHLSGPTSVVPSSGKPFLASTQKLPPSHLSQPLSIQGLCSGPFRARTHFASHRHYLLIPTPILQPRGVQRLEGVRPLCR